MAIKKTAQYRFADISYGDTEDVTPQVIRSLEHYLEQCKNNYPNNSPTFEFVEQSECLIASHETINSKTRIHLVMYEQGAGAAVIAALQGSENVEISEAPPPNDREFIEAQLFIICEGNHILWVSHNKSLRVGTVQKIIRQILDTYLNQQTIPNIFLLAVADTNKFANLLNDGVSSIEMDFFGYREAYEYAQQNSRIDGAGFFSDLFNFMSSEHEPSDGMDRMKTRVLIKPGRNWSIPSIRTHLENVAIKAMDNVSEDGEVTIVTKAGTRIKSSSLIVQETFNASGDKRLLNIAETFANLETVYTHLSHNDRLTTT